MARQITVSFAADASKLTKALGDVEKQTKSFGDKLSAAGNKMTVGFTLPVVAGLGMAVKAAAEDEAAQVKLAKTIENVIPGAGAAVVKSVEDQITAFQKMSTFSDDELRPAFAALVSETRNVTEAQDLMRTAMDLAAARGIPLEEAANILVKAHNGQTRALAALGIETKNTEGTAASFQSVMEDVNKVVGGQAQEALDTTAGRSAALKRDLGEMAEEIGTKVLPIVTKLAEGASAVLDFFTSLPEPVQNAGLILVGLAAAAGPIMKTAEAFGKLKGAILAIEASAAPALAALAPLAAAGGLIQQYASADASVGLGKGHDPVGIIKGLVGGIMDLLPGRAAGGPVMAGQSYVVGERGPELFTPGASGSVSSGGGAATVVAKLYLDGRQIQESLLRLQRTSGNLGIIGA